MCAGIGGENLGHPVSFSEKGRKQRGNLRTKHFVMVAAPDSTLPTFVTPVPVRRSLTSQHLPARRTLIQPRAVSECRHTQPPVETSIPVTSSHPPKLCVERKHQLFGRFCRWSGMMFSCRTGLRRRCGSRSCLVRRNTGIRASPRQDGRRRSGLVSGKDSHERRCGSSGVS